MPIKGTFPKNVKKLIRTNSLYIEYTFFRPNLQKFGKKLGKKAKNRIFAKNHPTFLRLVSSPLYYWTEYYKGDKL